MKPNTLLTGAASNNGTSAGSFVGRHCQTFTLVELTIRQTQKNRANDNCGSAVIGCQTEGITNSHTTSGKEIKRMNRSKRNSRPCHVNRQPWSQRVGGFTLIELLVVISIISLLMGVLVSVIHRIKEKAILIQCQSNIRTLYETLRIYADDNDGRFPNVTDLTQVPLKVKEALQPYVKSEKIFWCPADPNKPTPTGGGNYVLVRLNNSTSGPTPTGDGSYEWCVTHDPKRSLAGRSLDLIRQPDSVIIGGERSQGWHELNMMNVLFADGHVEQVTVEDWFRNITRSLQ
jgi:prepilin-type N-terminal cleavage/methylation domain-containing protein/prepilin-type processing-associated H-X9-DG protein